MKPYFVVSGIQILTVKMLWKPYKFILFINFSMDIHSLVFFDLVKT